MAIVKSSKALGKALIRRAFQLIGTLVLCVAVALPLLVWRLSQGPIQLDFMNEYLEQALSLPEQRFSVSIKSTRLMLSPDDGILEIRTSQVKSYADGQLLSSLPEMAITLDGRALLLGRLAPKSLRLFEPRLVLVRDAQGQFLWQMDASTDNGLSNDAIDGLLAALTSEGDQGIAKGAGASLDRVAIVQADLQIKDELLGVVWAAPDVDVVLERIEGGLSGQLSSVLNLDGNVGALTLGVRYAKAMGSIQAEVNLSGIRPSSFAILSEQLDPLRALDVPLAGKVSFRGTLKELHELGFEFKGGEGVLNIPEPISIHTNISQLAVKGALLEGGAHLRLDELSLDAGGPVATISAMVESLNQPFMKVEINGKVKDVPFDRLDQLWPPMAGKNARDWVIANLSKGIAPHGDIAVKLHSPTGKVDDIVLDHIGGEIHAQGVQVDYLRPMRPAQNVSGIARYNASSFDIEVTGGNVDHLRLTSGMINLMGLDQEDQFAKIDLKISGPIREALLLIDSKPLEYAKMLGINPEPVNGMADTHLVLDFPLVQDLGLDQVEVDVKAKAKAAYLPKMALDLDVSEGDLDLHVTAKGLTAKGGIKLGSIPAHVVWTENFSAQAPFTSRFDIKAPQISEAQRKELGLDFFPFINPVMVGDLAADVDVVLKKGGAGKIDARLDLTSAHMAFQDLGWRKESRTSGKAEVTIVLKNNQLAEVPQFSVVAGDLNAKGRVSFQKGDIKSVQLEQLAFGGRTDVTGTISFLGQGRLGLDIAGRSFDASALVGNGEVTPDEVSRKEQARLDPKEEEKNLPPITLKARLDRLYLSKDGVLNDLSGQIESNGDIFTYANIHGRLPSNNDVSIVIDTKPQGPRILDVRTMDAGGLLKALDLTRHINGGEMVLSGVFDDQAEFNPLTGRLKISQYHVQEAPALARLLSVAALTGIGDLLRGQGIHFSMLDAPFTLRDGLISFDDASASGSSLGLTAKGEVDIDRGNIAVEGTVVPAYALNAVLGKIPVVGWLVTGGEKGGGLVAFNYSMRGNAQDPDVTVNPLSALTPGFMRNLFKVFDDGSEVEARPRE